MQNLIINNVVFLNRFDSIVPCGIKDKYVTSLDQELGYNISFEEVFSLQHSFS